MSQIFEKGKVYQNKGIEYTPPKNNITQTGFDSVTTTIQISRFDNSLDILNR
jgi:hypothetical protein